MRINGGSTAALGVALILAAAALPAAPGARAQTAAECENEAQPEPAGPTDISATSGNQGLSVALNEDATVTVFKWPSPSYYDQLKYHTSDRRLEHMGALPNEGALIGIAYKPNPQQGEDGPRWGFSWLRDWRSSQRFADDDTDEVITKFRKGKLGLKVKVKDLVPADRDALLRKVVVKRTKRSDVRKVRVFAFANYNPVFSKTQQAPYNDWCNENDEDSGGAYLVEEDVVVQERAGIDAGSGASSSIAVGLGFDRSSDGHHVGPDTYAAPRVGISAYDDAADGQLEPAGSESGQVDAALYDQFALGRDRKGVTTAILGAAGTQDDLISLFEAVRGSSYGTHRSVKRWWWKRWLREAAVPAGGTRKVKRLAKRALISIRQATDRSSGLISASIATQSPYGLDWVRWGAYINDALARAGHPEMVEKHNRRYGELMSRAGFQPPGGAATPQGNWSHNFYADGVVGGPKSYEIDSTGLGMWTLYEHYRREGSKAYLNSSEIYESIQRAAHYLSDDPPLGCRSTTGVYCAAPDENSSTPRQSLIGAQAIWLGLDAAVAAAEARNTPGSLLNAEKWAARRDEVAAAIKQTYLDEDCNCYTSDPATGGTFLWPVGFVRNSSKVAAAQAEENWTSIRRSINGKNDVGGFESRAVLGNAHVWAKNDARAKRLRRALKWIASVPTTDTGLLGRNWMVFPPQEGVVTTMNSQPDVVSMTMFYLAALKTYGSRPWSD